MKLDQASYHALNLFRFTSDSKEKYGNLFNLLNECKTKFGSSLLEQWIRKPLLHLNQIHQRQQCVTELIHNPEFRQFERELLKGIPNVDKIIMKLQKEPTLNELVILYQFFMFKFVEIVEKLKHHVEKQEEEYEMELKERGNENEKKKNEIGDMEDISDNNSSKRSGLRRVLDQLEQCYHTLLGSGTGYMQEVTGFFPLIENCVAVSTDIESQSYGSAFESPYLNPTWVRDLDMYHTRRKEMFTKLLAYREEVQSKLGIDVKLVSWKEVEPTRFDQSSLDKRWLLRVPESKFDLVHSKMINDCDKILSNKAHGFLFTNERLKKLSKYYEMMRLTYEQAAEPFLYQLVTTSLTYKEVFLDAMKGIAELDIYLAFAVVATNSPNQYCCPTVLESDAGRIEIKAARHPLRERLDPSVPFIPNDVELIRGTNNFRFITGPNAGGKSTYIRMIGCLCLLTQIGSYIPAESAVISIVDGIYARVGAMDSTMKGVSTFMNEMNEISEIIKNASTNSLLMIDELGRGTSTSDGYGIAYAIAEYIAKNIHSYTLFATHFHELTILSQQQSELGIANSHVTVNVDEASKQITMLYKLEEGAADRSYGVNVAEMVGFPKEIVDAAKRKAEELEKLAVMEEEIEAEEEENINEGEQKGTEENREEKKEEGKSLLSMREKFLKQWKGVSESDPMWPFKKLAMECKSDEEFKSRGKELGKQLMKEKGKDEN